jgi:hypothetical protein
MKQAQELHAGHRSGTSPLARADRPALRRLELALAGIADAACWRAVPLRAGRKV